MKKKKEKNVLEGNTFNMSSLKEPKSPEWTIWSKYGSLQTKKTSLLTPFCLGAFDFDNETTNKKRSGIYISKQNSSMLFLMLPTLPRVHLSKREALDRSALFQALT